RADGVGHGHVGRVGAEPPVIADADRVGVVIVEWVVVGAAGVGVDRARAVGGVVRDPEAVVAAAGELAADVHPVNAGRREVDRVADRAGGAVVADVSRLTDRHQRLAVRGQRRVAGDAGAAERDPRAAIGAGGAGRRGVFA